MLQFIENIVHASNVYQDAATTTRYLQESFAWRIYLVVLIMNINWVLNFSLWVISLWLVLIGPTGNLLFRKYIWSSFLLSNPVTDAVANILCWLEPVGENSYILLWDALQLIDAACSHLTWLKPLQCAAHWLDRVNFFASDLLQYCGLRLCMWLELALPSLSTFYGCAGILLLAPWYTAVI